MPFQLQTHKRLHGLLTCISEEIKDVVLYYKLPDLCSTVRCTAPPTINIHAALVNCGYKVSNFHHEPSALKTNAPNDVVSI
jgi:tRNA (guanine26-N2/guanine27-N2)-dimethyltransferase